MDVLAVGSRVMAQVTLFDVINIIVCLFAGERRRKEERRMNERIIVQQEEKRADIPFWRITD